MCSAVWCVITWSFVSKMLTADTPSLVHEDGVWDVLCEPETWSSHCIAVFNTVVCIHHVIAAPYCFSKFWSKSYIFQAYIFPHGTTCKSGIKKCLPIFFVPSKYDNQCSSWLRISVLFPWYVTNEVQWSYSKHTISMYPLGIYTVLRWMHVVL